MGTSNPATLRALAVAREAAAQTDLLADIRAEAQRAADNSQFLVDQLGGPVVTPEPAPEEVTDAPVDS